MFQKRQFSTSGLITGPHSAGDNSPERLVDIFFYGLYQDPAILARPAASE